MDKVKIDPIDFGIWVVEKDYFSFPLPELIYFFLAGTHPDKKVSVSCQSDSVSTGPIIARVEYTAWNLMSWGESVELEVDLTFEIDFVTWSDYINALRTAKDLFEVAEFLSSIKELSTYGVQRIIKGGG